MGLKLKSLRRRASLIVISVVLLAGLLAMILLGREVQSNLEKQRAAESDNLQFTLAQVEVDYLNFLNVLESFQDRPENIDAVRRRFDIFYSRILTLLEGRQFANLRDQSEWWAPLVRVETWLNTTAVLIDGPAAELSAGVDALRQSAYAQGADVRSLSIVALAFFANNTDQSRALATQTLVGLAWLIFSLFVVMLGLSIFLLFVNRKLMAREEALGQANNRMNKILSTALDGVIVADSHGRVIEFNPAAQAIFGYTAGFAKGRTVSELIVPDHLRDAHDDGMARMLTGEPRRVIGRGRVKMEARRATGQTFPVEIALQNAVDGGEEIIIGFVRDISLRVANEQELIKARDRALAGEQAKADFLTVMSHEIRTPLNGLLGNLSLLDGAKSDKEQARLVRNMDISGQVLLSHVDSVLDIARLEAGKMELQAGPVDLSDLLQGIVDGQSGNATMRGNRISWQWVGRARPHITADEARLGQVFLNLVGNAIKFTDGGTIQIEVEVSEMVPGSDRALFEFRVIDTGAGIAEEDLARIFEDFETVDPSIERATEGTGLGLAISKRLVRLMGGEIGVESILGEGSVFWVRLPMQLRSAYLQPDRAEAPVSQPAPLDILVVEDNQINLELAQTMLERDGHKVTLALNGQSGFMRAAEHRFDVILMDISMPVMDGLTATRQIRSGAGASRDVPIIALSANVLPDAMSRIRDAGMNGFLGKPISIEMLRQALLGLRTRQWTGGPGQAGKSPFDEAREELGETRFWRLLAAFKAEMDAALETGRALDWTDPDSICGYREDCHRFAGSAAVFGLSDLRATLQSIENSGNAGPEELRARFERFERMWAQEKAAIEAERVP